MKCSEARLCKEAFSEDFLLPCPDTGPQDFLPLAFEASFCLSLRMLCRFFLRFHGRERRQGFWGSVSPLRRLCGCFMLGIEKVLKRVTGFPVWCHHLRFNLTAMKEWLSRMAATYP